MKDETSIAIAVLFCLPPSAFRGQAYLIDAQAAEVSHQVKALAELLTSQEAGKNHYQGIFAELYRRFGVGSYKIIRQEQYAAVLAFLSDWRRAVQAGHPPA